VCRGVPEVWSLNSERSEEFTPSAVEG